MSLVLFSPSVILLAVNLASAVVVLGGIAVAADRLLRRSPLALRHGLLCLAVILILASPLLAWLAGSRGLGLVAVSGGAPAHEGTSDSLDRDANRADRPVASFPNRGPSSTQPTNSILPRSTAGDPVPVPASGRQLSEATGPHSAGGMNSFRVAASVLVLVWSAISLLFALRLVRGIHLVARFRRSLVPTQDVRVIEAARQAFAAAGVTRSSIFESPLPRAPLTLGWWRPVVVMPAGLAGTLDDEQLACVLAHEAAHVTRRDAAMALLQRVAATLYWWNPLLHVINRRIDVLREQMCDDQVAWQRRDGMPLAEALVQVAEWSAARPGLLSLTVSLVDNECDLAQRVARLAEANPTGPIRLSKKSLASLVAFALVFGAVPMVPILRSRVASPQSATAAGPPNATQVEPLDANAAAKQAGEATALIRVSGRAIDQAGTPVAGAKIYLVSTNSIDKQLGETTTNANGTYEFRDVNLPLRTTAQGESGGTLQIYGEADGFGFAWHGMRHYQPKPRAADRPRDAHEFGFYQNEPIEMNLTFRRAADLTGSVKDENGKSVPNVQVTLRGLDYLGTEGRELQPNYREFWAQYAAPPRFREVRTDEEGRFAFHGLPAETAGHITIEHPDFPSQSFFAAITTKKITEYRFIANSSVTIVAGKLVHTPIWETRAVKTSPLDISLHSARRVAIRVLQEDKNSPAKDVRVHAASGDFATGTYATGNTDERGNVELKLPPGKYRLVADPPRDATYVRTYDELMVTAEPRDQTAEMRLKPGCILILEAVDAASGLPIADVSFWCELDGQAGSRIGVISSTTWVDHPVTNAKGELRAVVFPGKRKYGAGWSPLPSGYRADLSGTKLVNCEPGKTVRVEFKLSK